LITKREHGQSLLEFAGGVLILVILLSGLVDIGRIYISFIAIQEGSQEGALYGSVNATDTLGIISKVRTSSNSPVNLGDATTVSVSSSLTGLACAGNTIKVTVGYNFEFITPLVDLVVGAQQIPLSVTTSSMILTPACP